MSYKTKNQTNLENIVKTNYNEVQKISKLVEQGTLEATSSESVKIVGYNQKITKAYAELEKSGILSSLIYKKKHPDLGDVLDAFPKEMKGTNAQFTMILPKKEYNAEIIQRAGQEYNQQHGTNAVKIPIITKWLKQQYNSAKVASKKNGKKLSYSDFLSTKYGQGMVCGKGSDFGIVLPKTYKLADAVLEINSSDLENIVGQIDGISLKQLNGAYLISADKKISGAKVALLGVTGVALTLAAYNAYNGEFDMSSASEFLKNFYTVKSTAETQMPAGNIVLGPEESMTINGEVSGEILEGMSAEGPINLEFVQEGTANFNFSESARIVEGTGTLTNFNGELYDANGTLIDFGNFSAHTDLTGIELNQNGEAVLNNFNGYIRGEGTISDMMGSIEGNGRFELSSGQVRMDGSFQMNGGFRGIVSYGNAVATTFKESLQSHLYGLAGLLGVGVETLYGLKRTSPDSMKVGSAIEALDEKYLNDENN